MVKPEMFGKKFYGQTYQRQKLIQKAIDSYTMRVCPIFICYDLSGGGMTKRID
eukprot:CAMPEP_0114680054 /NCGR_PEP_ID=MMETSP0191-20121206/53636_1 /TAXON_ID=126664 /ORGANISM="Sorites sp." /LENGTH=52 /DNA_ID=CAMNT_0001956237 /DNA_START=8 /DNA_END=163 /DNA_ORIENTATION=+